MASVNMGATVISESRNAKSESLLILNGASQTASTFTALAHSLIAGNVKVSTVILLDFPGHGHSGFPLGGRSQIPAEAVAKGWIAVEPATVVAEWLGLPPFVARPTIDPNIFTDATGTVAGIVALEQDPLYLFPDEHRAVYEFTTGDPAGRLFFALAGENTVHNLHTIGPGAYNKIIKRVLHAARGDKQ